ncbi:MAG: hypothetical protein IH994_05645 [Proteobacteria bacterium]|nr:hypothetical protein [Pseudomonadota bacterium]
MPSRDIGEELADEDLAILERYVERHRKDPGDSDASKSDTDHSDGSDDQQPEKE